MDLIDIAQKAKEASYYMMNCSTITKNKALNTIADAIELHLDEIIEQNQIDLFYAKENGISESMADRLVLDEKRIIDMAESLRFIASLVDPVGGADGIKQVENGLRIEKRRVPIGVVGVIYESRPNVTVDVVGLCIKSGNSVILRGGKEAINSNRVLVNVIHNALDSIGFPKIAVGFIDDTSREVTKEFMKLNQYVDVLMPRGGAGLIQSVVQNSTIPVIETGAGNCHIYVDESADLQMAKDILINAKCSRPSVCNAAEKLLVHSAVAEKFLVDAEKALKENNVEIRASERAKNILKDAVLATQEDWSKEYNDFIIAVKIVDNLQEAIEHINKYSTKHSEAIITQNYNNAQIFLAKIDSSAVYVNASTRFTDGGEFGLGAEIGISTQKLHARGPMGLSALTTYKYCVYGDGQIR